MPHKENILNFSWFLPSILFTHKNYGLFLTTIVFHTKITDYFWQILLFTQEPWIIFTNIVFHKKITAIYVKLKFKVWFIFCAFKVWCYAKCYFSQVFGQWYYKTVQRSVSRPMQLQSIGVCMPNTRNHLSHIYFNTSRQMQGFFF